MIEWLPDTCDNLETDSHRRGSSRTRRICTYMWVWRVLATLRDCFERCFTCENGTANSTLLRPLVDPSADHFANTITVKKSSSAHESVLCQVRLVARCIYAIVYTKPTCSETYQKSNHDISGFQDQFRRRCDAWKAYRPAASDSCS